MNDAIRMGRLVPQAAATLALALACLLPAAASAQPINFSGSVNNVIALDASTFTVGDALSGAIDVNVESGNTFSLTDLNSFDLTIGPAEFNLDSSDFGSLSGQLSDDGSTLTEFELASNFVSVPGLDSQYGLGFNGVNQPFSVTGTDGSIAEGNFTTNVGGGAANVPEPPMLALFGLSVLAFGFSARRRQRA